jgi:ubiquitin carboxyl-terminal hydrolase L5
MFEFEDKNAPKDDDAFHFVAYLPINGRIYELDGLKEAPIDLGPIGEKQDWTSSIRPILEKRMMKFVDYKIDLLDLIFYFFVFFKGIAKVK